ncbi:MAG: outer membrane beta-barrel protein [Steroidobacteraceae bacterium]
MPSRSSLCKAALALAPLLVPLPALADDPGRIAVGARLQTTMANGVPANDMPGYGVYGLYRLNDQWAVGLSVDRTEFDYEEPARRLGIPLDPAADPIDAKAEATIISASVERSFSAPEASREWFLGGAVGVADTDVPDITGPTATGGTFEIHTEVDRELIVSLLGGVRQRFAERWFAEFTLRADQHFAAWEPEDRVSGATARHDDYFAYGFHLGIGYRF